MMRSSDFLKKHSYLQVKIIKDYVACISVMLNSFCSFLHTVVMCFGYDLLQTVAAVIIQNFSPVYNKIYDNS